MEASPIVIIIPVYQEMNALEKISIQQAVKVLNKYRICLVVPAAMDVSNYLVYHDFAIERFADSYFTSIASYSRLLLSTSFYERFKEYEYMLIYQLDAFVFRDAIEEFCAFGYDYYGAPWRLSDTGRISTGNPVGNGGVSLRNIPHTIDVLRKYEQVVREKVNMFIYEQGEDVFFAWAAMQPDSHYKTPPHRIAKKFALECDVQHVFADIENNMPFAIHKWYQRDYSFWKPHIETQVYTINDQDPHIRWRTTKDDRLTAINRYLIHRIIRHTTEKCLKSVVRKYIPPVRDIYIYGKGKIGERTIKLLQKSGIQITGIIDKEGTPGQRFMGAEFFRLQDIHAKKLFVIISSTTYEAEMKNALQMYGLREGTDYITYNLLEKKIIGDYYALPFQL